MSIKEYYAEKLEKINIRKMTHPVVIKENIRPHLTIPIYKIILNMSKKFGNIRTPKLFCNQFIRQTMLRPGENTLSSTPANITYKHLI